MAKKKDRMYRAWYTHKELLELPLSKLKEMAAEHEIEFDDPNNPTLEELAEVYQEVFEEMSDPWEITANGECKVEEVKTDGP
jgi:hypothetical protein